MKKLNLTVGLKCPEGYKEFPFCGDHPFKAVKDVLEFVSNMNHDIEENYYVTSPYVLEALCSSSDIESNELSINVSLVSDDGEIIDTPDGEHVFLGYLVKGLPVEFNENSDFGAIKKEWFNVDASLNSKLEASFWSFNRSEIMLEDLKVKAHEERINKGEKSWLL